PSADTQQNQNAQLVQVRWLDSLSDTSLFQLRGAFLHANLSSQFQDHAPDFSTMDLPTLSLSGAAPLALDGTRTRFEIDGAYQTVKGEAANHVFDAELHYDHNTVHNDWTSLAPVQQILVEGVPSEIVRWNTPANSSQQIQNLALSAQDSWRLNEWLRIPVGLRMDASWGSASGAARSLSWFTLEPRIGAIVSLHPGTTLI